MIGLNKEEYSLFVREAIRGSIVVGGVCNIGCVFCACRSSYKAIGRRNWINFISLEDLESVMPFVGISYYRNDDNQYGFSLGDGNYFFSCEPFLHPQYIDIIKVANAYKPDWIKYTATTGQFVDMRHLDLYHQARMKFYVSINSFDIETRKKLMKRYEYGNLLDFLRNTELIYRLSLMFTGDLDILNRDIENIYKFGLDKKEIRLWLPFVSQYSPREAKNIFQKAKSKWHDAVAILRKNIPNNIPSITEIDDFDEVGEVIKLRNEFDIRMNKLISYINKSNVKLDDVGFLISSSVWNYAVKKWKFINIKELKNVSFGGSYTISSIITKKDVMHAIKNFKFKHYAVPNEIFDAFGFDLALNHIKDYNLSLFLG